MLQRGCLPQTRFVLGKALHSNLRIIVVVNKIDRQDARPQAVLDEIYDLFIDLDANEEQIEFPVLYAIGRDGVIKKSMEDESEGLPLLFNTILEEIPPPSHDPNKPFQMLVSNLGYSDYLGRLAIGRVVNGSLKKNEAIVAIDRNADTVPVKTSQLQIYGGLTYKTVEQLEPGDIAILSGIENIEIGDTICAASAPEALKRIAVDEPTISMKFSVNSSPLSGLDGKYVQSTKIKERLEKETLHNVALRVIEEEGESFTVQGRGEFQMAILLETMRREGFELSVGRPEIIYKEVDGQRHEPIEHLFIDCDEEFTGIVTEKLSFRKGRMLNLVNHGSGRVRLEFSIPSRGLIGYRGEFLTDTRGTGIINALLEGYEPYRGDFPSRTTGSLVADRAGEAVPYALFNLEARGQLFITSGEKVYEGMIIGEHNRESDLNVNPCKTKKHSNVRAAGKDEAVVLTPILPMTLEHAIEFIRDDELIEVTPSTIRLRKTTLAANMRKPA